MHLSQTHPPIKFNMKNFFMQRCGKTGIRTLGTVARSPHFECGPIDHSGIFPCCKDTAIFGKKKQMGQKMTLYSLFFSSNKVYV